MSALEPVLIFADASVDHGSGCAGWAAVIRYRDRRWEIGGPMWMNEINRAELQSVMNALKAVPPGCRAVVFNDNQSVMKAHAGEFSMKGVGLIWHSKSCFDSARADWLAKDYRKRLQQAWTLNGAKIPS